MQSNDSITQAGKQQHCITKKLKSCEFNNTPVGDLCKQLETTEAMTSLSPPNERPNWYVAHALSIIVT